MKINIYTLYVYENKYIYTLYVYENKYIYTLYVYENKYIHYIIKMTRRIRRTNRRSNLRKVRKSMKRRNNKRTSMKRKTMKRKTMKRNTMRRKNSRRNFRRMRGGVTPGSCRVHDRTNKRTCENDKGCMWYPEDNTCKQTGSIARGPELMRARIQELMRVMLDKNITYCVSLGATRKFKDTLMFQYLKTVVKQQIPFFVGAYTPPPGYNEATTDEKTAIRDIYKILKYGPATTEGRTATENIVGINRTMVTEDMLQLLKDTVFTYEDTRPPGSKATEYIQELGARLGMPDKTPGLWNELDTILGSTDKDEKESKRAALISGIGSIWGSNLRTDNGAPKNIKTGKQVKNKKTREMEDEMRAEEKYSYGYGHSSGKYDTIDKSLEVWNDLDYSMMLTSDPGRAGRVKLKGDELALFNEWHELQVGEGVELKSTLIDLYAAIQQFLYLSGQDYNNLALIAGKLKGGDDSIVKIVQKHYENGLRGKDLVYTAFNEFINGLSRDHSAWIQTDYYEKKEEGDDSLSIALTVCMCRDVYVTFDTPELYEKFLESFPVTNDYEKKSLVGPLEGFNVVHIHKK